MKKEKSQKNKHNIKSPTLRKPLSPEKAERKESEIKGLMQTKLRELFQSSI